MRPSRFRLRKSPFWHSFLPPYCREQCSARGYFVEFFLEKGVYEAT